MSTSRFEREPETPRSKSSCSMWCNSFIELKRVEREARGELASSSAARDERECVWGGVWRGRELPFEKGHAARLPPLETLELGNEVLILRVENLPNLHHAWSTSRGGREDESEDKGPSFVSMVRASVHRRRSRALLSLHPSCWSAPGEPESFLKFDSSATFSCPSVRGSD